MINLQLQILLLVTCLALGQHSSYSLTYIVIIVCMQTIITMSNTSLHHATNDKPLVVSLRATTILLAVYKFPSSFAASRADIVQSLGTECSHPLD